MLANIFIKKFFILLLYLNPLILQSFLFNQDYCSVKEQEYTYNTLFSKTPMIDLFDDMFDDKDFAEFLTDGYFEMSNFKNDSVQWLINVKSISSNLEYYEKGKEYYYKKLRLHTYELREKNEVKTRHTINKNAEYRVYEPNYDYLAERFLTYTEAPIPFLEIPFFYANNMDFNEFCFEINDYVDNDDYEFSLEKINLNTQIVGIKVVFNDDMFENMNDLIWSIRYNDGILYKATLTYKNEYIYLFELKDFSIILYENWLLILLITIVIIIVIIAYIYVKSKLN